MASRLRVRMNSRGARAALNAPGVIADLQARAERVEAAANGMMGPRLPSDLTAYRVLPAKEGRNRARVSVWTGGYASRRDNAKNNTLLKALGSAG